MPQTKIFVTTYMCPNGIGNVDAECRFHRRWDNLPKDNKCPTCKSELVKAVLDEDRMTMIVIGEEDIEPEIERIEKRKGKGEPKMDDPDVSTGAKKNAYQAKRRKDIQEAIREARKHEDK